MNFENLLNGSEQWGEVGGRHKLVGGRRSPPSRPDYTPGSEIFNIKRENNSKQPVKYATIYLIEDIYIAAFKGNYSGGDPFKRAT